jgi:HPt (histidine-containing phosphotransfer) domain-containing protein
MVSHVNNAVDKKDPEQLRFWAHKLKGSSVTLGIEVLTEISSDLEKFGKENIFNEETYRFNRALIRNFDIVIGELELLKDKFSKV